MANIKVAGTFEGTPESVPVYGISVQPNMPNAGIIKQTPMGDSFNANTQITLEADESFGYKFVNWTDADGQVVAETPLFVHTLTSDAEFTANFEPVNTYVLNLTVENANDYYIQLSNPGVMVDGKRMYEEGTEVSLTAWANEVYTFL